MANRVLVDTDALIGLLRADPSWSDRIETLREQKTLLTTDVNAFELYLGAHLSTRKERNLASVKGLLNTIPLLHTSEDAMEVAARLTAGLKQKGKPLDIKDTLIAAMALVHGAAALTGNREHFERIDGLELLE